METKTKKNFDAVQFARAQKEELSKKLAKMTKAEIVAYFKKVREESHIKPTA